MHHNTHTTHSHDVIEEAPRTAGHVIRWARLYDPFVSLLALGRAGAVRAATIEIAGVAAGETVLEVGCGTAEVALAAARRGATVCGIDPAPEMIAVAREKARRDPAGSGLDLRVGAIEALPFPDASFDLVLSSLMFHHLPPELKRAGLAEVRRVLKPGGRFVVVDFKRPTAAIERAASWLMLHGGQRDGIEALPAMLAAAGFQSVARPPSRFRTLGFVVATAG